ncbi:uncharacterized protein LOC115034690 [Acyrthosiphon pisum]|uniref:Uncharacterized protein n=1 Tax=Acyrthosiphon pisum TaxID=7029 RepID=A0A8R2NTA3_ACYPI|nr:uncharacterized protein LOC115034505 [Acyrthosiphon pisum]XP_029347659.1 uncharacterized protein LOC115034505 [Acyrthosiphon pisum]XP_029347886.1 uncharacterized protein LOC115034690 [Acyrthosiphon pisum]XP_029347887.1 uncharacterized protein LOC115034690 [Acyrthosiphon pisum]
MWRAYNTCGQIFSGHGVVNHTVNFVEPPKHLPPIWVPAGRFSPECLDKQWEDALPPNMEPIRYHTQHIERSWRELKRVLTRCNCPRVSTSYIGEWMYRTNILNREGGIQQQFCRFMRDIGRAYPGIGYIPMTRDIEDCQCPEC